MEQVHEVIIQTIPQIREINNFIDIKAIQESIAYRSPIRKSKIIKNEGFLPIVTESDFKHVGCMLSGGIDSTLVLSRLSQENISITAFTLKWNKGAYDETEKAKEILSLLKDHNKNIRHKIIEIDIEEFVELYNDIPKYGPHPRPAYYPVIMAAKKKGLKVLYSGEGGDELYGGYVNKYRKMLRVKKISTFRHLGRLCSFLPGRYDRFCWILKNSCSWSSYEASRTLTRDIFFPNSFRQYERRDWMTSTLTLDYEVRLKHYIDFLNRMSRNLGVQLVFPLMEDSFKPQNWREYWEPHGRRKLPLVNELTDFDPQVADLAIQDSHGFSPPTYKFLWKYGLRELVLNELKDSPVRKVIGKKLNGLIDFNDNDAGEGELRALTEAYCITKYLRNLEIY